MKSCASISRQRFLLGSSLKKVLSLEFIERISWKGKLEDKQRGINVTKWYEMVSFDVLGEMAFGQSFGCVRSGELRHIFTCSLLAYAMPHFWAEPILEHNYFLALDACAMRVWHFLLV